MRKCWFSFCAHGTSLDERYRVTYGIYRIAVLQTLCYDIWRHDSRFSDITAINWKKSFCHSVIFAKKSLCPSIIFQKKYLTLIFQWLKKVLALTKKNSNKSLPYHFFLKKSLCPINFYFKKSHCPINSFFQKSHDRRGRIHCKLILYKFQLPRSSRAVA